MLSSRRAFCLAFLVLQVTVFSPTTSLAADDLETIRSRVMAPLLSAPDTKSVGRLVLSMESDGTWANIDYSNKSRSGWQVPTHLSRVAVLARAYSASKSALHGDREVLVAALKGLDAWLRLDPQNPNWWWNQIGVPRTLLPIMLLLDDELSETQREAGLKILRRSKIGMTGQNLVWVTEVTAGRGLLENDADLVAKAYRRIADEIRVSMGEGIQPDFSFHQHGPCLYSHGYGAGFIVDCSRIAVRVNGTAMAFPADKIELLAHLILDGTQWMVRGNATDFGGEGREITRKGQSTSHLVAAASYMLKLKTGREEEFRALAARAAGRSDAPPLVGNRHFWRADFMTHHRPKYYASARTHSKRLANTDGPANSEGLLSHHLADGCFVLMQTGKEYRDIFGVWDWQKIPGTTVRQKPELKGSPRRMGTTEFVGGVSDGTFGLAACDFSRGSINAKKSWFFLDDEIVCLGAGIDADPGESVLTTLNQCFLKGDVVLSTADSTKVLDHGDHTSETPQWVWHDSVAYGFLEPAKLHLQNDAKSGSWYASSHSHPNRQETGDLFTAWIDHGTEPEGASYGYVVVPAVARDETARYLTEMPVRVLANRNSLQAVVHDGLGLLGAAFFEPAEIEVRAGLTIQVDTPCLLLARETSGELQLTVANPENKAAEVNVVVSSGGSNQKIVIPLSEGPQAGSSVMKTISLK
jgi:chondroitin AC lyase